MNELKEEISLATHGNIPYIAGADPCSFLITHTKKAVSDPACGVEPYKFGGAQKAGQTPQSGQVICVYTKGQKAGLTPHLGFNPAIGALCKHSKYYLTTASGAGEKEFT